MLTISKFWHLVLPAKTMRWLESADVLYTQLEFEDFDNPLEREAELEFLAEAQWAYNPLEHILAFVPLPSPSMKANYLLAIAPRSAVEQALYNCKKESAQVLWQIPKGLGSGAGETQSDFNAQALCFYPDYRAQRKAANQRFYLHLIGVCVLVGMVVYGWGLRLEAQSRGLQTQLVQLEANKQLLQGAVQNNTQRLQAEQMHLRLVSELNAKITKLTQPLNTPALSLDTLRYDGAGFQVQGVAQDLEALARASKTLPGVSLDAQARIPVDHHEEVVGAKEEQKVESVDAPFPVRGTENTITDNGLRFVLKWRP